MAEQLTSINPATEEKIKEYQPDNEATVEQKLNQSKAAFDGWKNISIDKRANYLRALAQDILDHKADMAAIATSEMGKPIAQSVGELEKCAMSLNYYADNAGDFLNREPVIIEGKVKSFVSFRPLGTVFAIMPWNFPYWQVYRVMGPILMGGNAMVLKHAPRCMGCAIAIEESFKRAGLPKGLFQSLIIPKEQSERVIAHSAVQAVTFTGSTGGGRKVAALAASYLKKQVLELGGSDAYVVLADADINHAVESCVQSRLNNTGQSCIAAKRFIVEKEVIDEFSEKAQILFKQKQFGLPTNEQNDLGAMARNDLRDKLHQQVEDSVAQGAKILCGGYIPKQKGAFYPPTLLTKVKKGMPAYKEEMFGPVGVIIEAENEEEAVAMANDTEYGLGGAVFSKDIERAERIAHEKMNSGSVFVNDFVSSNPRLPFGGIKNSGYGRELSYYGLREFVNIKSVSISEP